MGRTATMMTRLLTTSLLAPLLLASWPAASLLTVASCCCLPDNPDEGSGTTPVSHNLPALVLRDDTPDLLLTWLDEKGDHHVARRPPDVPEKGRDMVRVVTVDQGHGDVLYVADLRTKNEDGTYPVKTMPRSGWELLAQQRREKSMAALSPPASTSTGGSRTAPVAPPSARLTATVYGTSWCGVCRNAESYLRSQGVTVTAKDIEKDRGARKEMNEKLKKAGLPQDGSVPAIDIRGRMFKGFDQRAIDRAIKDSTRGDVL